MKFSQLCTLLVLLTASSFPFQTSLAGIVTALALPAQGVHVDGSTFTTAFTDSSGASFDIQYTLNAFAADETSVDAFFNSSGSLFGVGSVGDGTTSGQQQSFDGNDGEQASFTNLSITNFIAGASGLTQADFAISFNSLTFTNGINANDGVNISFAGFDNNVSNFSTPITSIDLTEITTFSSSATDLFIGNDSGQSNNRVSISGISVEVSPVLVAVPEPSSVALIGLTCLGWGMRRKRN